MSSKVIRNTIYPTTDGKYFVSIRINTKTKFGGTYNSKKDALAASKKLLKGNKITSLNRVVHMY